MDELDRKEFKTVAIYLEGKLNECGKRRKKINPDSPKQLEQMINTIVRALAIDETSDSGLNIPVVMQQSELFISFARFANNYGKGSYAMSYEDMFKEWCKKRNI